MGHLPSDVISTGPTFLAFLFASFVYAGFLPSAQASKLIGGTVS
jgi:hypothetical protein